MCVVCAPLLCCWENGRQTLNLLLLLPEEMDYICHWFLLWISGGLKLRAKVLYWSTGVVFFFSVLTSVDYWWALIITCPVPSNIQGLYCVLRYKGNCDTCGLDTGSNCTQRFILWHFAFNFIVYKSLRSFAGHTFSSNKWPHCGHSARSIHSCCRPVGFTIE